MLAAALSTENGFEPQIASEQVSSARGLPVPETPEQTRGAGITYGRESAWSQKSDEMTNFRNNQEQPFANPPFVSVIVPARNEEVSLSACLESLVSQPGICFEIIVVDDNSTDRTGKNNAMAVGARIAKGKWLLFTDADTEHKPGSLARAVAEAERNGAALLSYSPEQEVRGFWEKAVMPVIFAELAATYPLNKVSDPASPIAAANGQYLLISREACEAVGGHTKIASDLLEDVAMARLVKASGGKIFFRYGGDAVRTRMYRSFAQMREGWTKNLALLFPSAVRLSVLRLAEFLVLFGTGAIAVAAALKHQGRMAFLSGAVAVFFYGLFLLRIRKAHFRWGANLFAPVGLPIFSDFLLRSGRSYQQGSVTWKGRSYGKSGPAKVHTMMRPAEGEPVIPTRKVAG
jgi:Glycosyl transferase family 21